MILSPWGGGSISGGLLSALLLLLPLTADLAQAQIPLDLNNPESIKNAAFIAAHGMMRDYPGNRSGGIPGIWPQPPYYWWEGGAAWGALIDYWYYTGNTEYVDTITEALLWQTGPDNNYMPPNQSKALGNDDQCFWGLAVMAAAEKRFPDPPSDKPQWLALAQAVFNSQTRRWDNATCGGGLRWQIFTFNNGYDYKNTISNGCFFQLGARLARYTDNDTYAAWAERAYDWTVEAGLMSSDYRFFDGVGVPVEGNNCSSIDKVQWSYNVGTFLAGAAYMYNYTKEAKWKDRLDKIIDGTKYFFAVAEYKQGEDGVMFEVACEANNLCNVDQRSFKAYLSRFMTLAVKMAPYTYDIIMPKIQVSAKAAAKRCNGGTDGVTCSLRWAVDDWRAEYTGLGEQMAALEVIQSNLINIVGDPVTAATGGTSKGDPSAGMGDDKVNQNTDLSPVGTGDKVGAGFLTMFVLSGLLAGAYWMVI